MADGTPRKPSITLGNEVCNINASEPGSARKADGAEVRLPSFVVDNVLAGTGSTAAASTAASTSDVPVVGNTPSGVAARVQKAAAMNSATHTPAPSVGARYLVTDNPRTPSDT